MARLTTSGPVPSCTPTYCDAGERGSVEEDELVIGNDDVARRRRTIVDLDVAAAVEFLLHLRQLDAGSPGWRSRSPW